jgi:hypothetical protein
MNIGIGIGWAKALYSVANNVIANFKARVLSYPNSIFEAGPCLDATLEELNAIGLLDNASLVITPNAYTEGILYDVVPNTTLGDMTVVRATTATRVNSAGLIEVVPRNLLTYSKDLSSGYTLNQCTITSNQTAPDGTSNARRITNGATATDPYFEQSVSFTPTIHTWSVYVKQGTALTATIRPVHVGIGGDVSVMTFTFATETIVTSGVITTSGFTKLTNGWYRIFCSVNITSAVSSLRGRFGNPSVANVYNDWAYPQLEANTTATEYFPTTTRLNIPRIDYTNGSCPSLLVEPQRTNVLIQSNNFVSNWGNDGTSLVVNNFSISPDGTQNAARVTCIPTTGYSYRILPIIPVGKYTFSIYIKASTSTNINFGINDTGGSGANQINVSLTTNWKRFEITQNITLGTFVVIDYSALQLGINYDFYGAQVEAGSYATSYIPTVASSVTRNADVISKTGISSLIGTTYTIYGEIINEGIHNARHLALKLPTGGNYTDVVFIVQNFNGLQATANNSTSTAQFVINSGSYSIGQTLKYALRCEQNNVAFYINGVQIGVDTLCTIPAVSTLYIGNYVDLRLGSKIKSTMIFPSALTNTELQSLTTL